MVSGLEACADGMMKFEGWGPTTRSYRNRNPLNLRIPGTAQDAQGFTIFPDFVSGYTAGLKDLTGKFTGHNTHGLGPSSTLLQLMNVFSPSSDNNPTNAYAHFLASWLSQALGKAITVDSKLSDIWTAP
jgi:hypothetical protein